MTRTTDVKSRFSLRALKKVFAAVAITSLLSCGGGGGGSTDATIAAPAIPAAIPSAIPTDTARALTKFWDRYGAADTFPPMYVELVTKLLEAEDKVFAKDYQAARVIVEGLIKKYPLMANDQPDFNSWWGNYNDANRRNPRPHLGEPGPYAHLRMLDDITKMGIKNPMLGKTPIRMAVVIPSCTDLVIEEGPNKLTLLNEKLSPEIEAKDYEVVRQSLRLFQSYLLAISGGELSLEINFYKVNSNECFQINKRNDYLGGNFNAPLLALPAGVAAKTDMFWLIYPNDNDRGVAPSFSSGISMFYNTQKPVFMCDDDWILKKRSPDQGVGFRTDVERRFYLPEWFQHEFFHHLFASWPDLKLEGAKNHEWFDRAYWPADFVGKVEEDYYSESLNKRFYTHPVSIAQRLKRADK